MFMPNIYLNFYIIIIKIQCKSICKGNMQKGVRGTAAGAALGQGILGGSPKCPRGVHSVHWYPPGGGGGPKKRHLVLYKLAGFSPADREA